MSTLGTTRRGGRRSRADLPVNAEINVTSLVDVAFTLLVIFMITAPIMQGGIDVSIPRADVQPLTALDAPLIITVMSDGRIFMEDSEVTIEQLEASLPQLLAAGTIDQIFVRGDSLARWGPVVRTIAAAKNSGVRVSVVAQPYVEGR